MLVSHRHRFVVRKSLRNFCISIIEYSPSGDKVLFTVNSKSLSKLGWKGDNGNLPSSYLAGLLAGKKAIGMGIKDVVLDLGLNKSVKGSRIYAALLGATEAGLKIPFNPEVLPPKDRIAGEHIAKYAQSLRNDESKYKRQFSNYIKKGLLPENIVNHFNEVKGRING
jgi:large subunit ribosomal protein L18